MSAEIRAAVFSRADGRCEECGRVLDFDQSNADPDAMATIQHVEGDSSDLANLKAFCRGCNNADARTHFVPVTAGSPAHHLAVQLRQRWTAPSPLRVCDDQARWPTLWRDLKAANLQVIAERDAFNDAADDEDLAGFLGWTDQGTPIQDC